MSERRRMLLAIVNQFKWLPYSYTYLYHSLVPTTIDSKNVRNKAKFTKIYGNSEVVNQLLKPSAISTTISGITITNNNDGTFTISSGTTTGLVYYAMYLSTDKVQPKQGHTYLLLTNANEIGGISGFTIGSFGTYLQANVQARIFTIDNINNTDTCVIRIANGTNVSSKTFYACVIDLTQMFPFDTPTTLTDNRVKNIIAQGYIPYNLGEIKDMEIGEFSSEDSNNQPLGTLQLPALYKSSGIGTSKDSWEITNTSHIFTRNIWNVDLGTLDYTLASNCFYTSDTAINHKLVNGCPALCGKYEYITSDVSISGMYNDVGDKKICLNSANGRIYITDTSYANANDFKTAMNGVILKYQLATPQVITIPRKHLAVVDLGSLDYVSQGSGRFVSSGLTSTIKPVSDNANIGNVYCSEYLSVSYYNISTNMSICVHTSGNIYIQDSSKSSLNATDFKNAMNGVYLFYETENEVADITDTFDIEAGGTITSDSDVLPDVDFKFKCK